jgi:hypothetical protein
VCIVPCSALHEPQSKGKVPLRLSTRCSDPPSKFRHWDLVLFFLLLLLSFIVLCMYKGWFIPAIKKCVTCMQWTKARASGSKAAQRESMYDEMSATHVSAGGSSSEPIDDETI